MKTLKKNLEKMKIKKKIEKKWKFWEKNENFEKLKRMNEKKVLKKK